MHECFVVVRVRSVGDRPPPHLATAHGGQLLKFSDAQIETVQERLPSRSLRDQIKYLKTLEAHYKQSVQGHPHGQALNMQQTQQQLQAQKIQQQLQAQQMLQAQKMQEQRQLEEDGILPTTGGAMNIEALDEQTTAEESIAAKQPVFSEYTPMKVKLGHQHVEHIVESCSMASVEPPDVYYEPSLPEPLLTGRRGEPRKGYWGAHAECALSGAQLETVVYSGQRHALFNQEGSRLGFFVGDGTGVGKGRQIASVILDNMCQGRLRSIWVTISTALLHDSKRDFKDLGRPDVNVYPLHKLGYGELEEDIVDGVMFCTYQSLISKNKHGESRIDQIVDWAAEATPDNDPEQFDGCLCFDEAHRAKNLAPTDKGKGGTRTGKLVLEIQQRLPNARVLYVSATAAADVRDLAYMERLGLWGKGTPFPDFMHFTKEIDNAGVGAMELLAMDMKARGMFVSRMLSFEGCSFEKRECVLSEDQRKTYDDAVELWHDILKAFEHCNQLANQETTNTLRTYWGAHQMCFKQLLNSIKAKFAIDEAARAVRHGKCVVIGLISTGEARANEAVERSNRLGVDLDEVSTPHEIARDLITRHLPTKDAMTNEPIPEAFQKQRELLHQLESIQMPSNALDLIISYFGVERVAEMTGRKTRVVTMVDPETGERRTESQSRSTGSGGQDQVNIDEKDAFLRGDKLIAVISDAASSGISLHADARGETDPRFKNTRPRLHITLELAWSADKMLQQFGRTHRSNQLYAPEYLMLVTDVGGEQRFASSVARRLEMLGAITRGDRRGGHGAAADLVQFNLDTPQAHTALALMMDAIAEQADRQTLWDRVLRMLQSNRDGVPTLLALCVVAVVQAAPSPPQPTAPPNPTPPRNLSYRIHRRP